MRLTIIPPVIDGESAAAHLMRAFDVNGEPWSRERLRTAGHSLGAILQGRAAKTLADRVGRGEDAFMRWTPVAVTKRKVLVAGEEIHRDDWTTNERRWCPCCWRDDLRGTPRGRHAHWNIHRRFWWDVAAVDTCPLHGVRLAAACPTCGTGVTWEAGSLTRCRNGHSLLSCEGVEVASSDTMADAYVIGRLGGMDRMEVPILDGLTLAGACDAMERLGVARIGGADGALSRFPAERHAEVHSAGLAIARDWPHAFVALLDGMARADHVGLGAWGAEQVYGHLYLWAKRLPAGTSGDAVRTVLFAHHAARGPVHKTSVVIRHADAPLVSLADIAARCGRRSEFIAGYVKALGAWPERTKKGTPIGIARATAAEIRAILDRAVRAEDLPAALGLAKRQTRMLVGARIVPPADIHRRAGIKADVFDRDAIEAVLTRLRGDAPTVDAAPPGLLPLSRASQHGKSDGVRGTCEMILAGELRVRAILRDVPGLAGFLVDPDDIRAARRARGGGGLTLVEVGRRLTMPADVVGLIVRSGLLAGCTVSGETLVTEEALAAYEADYATTGALAREIGSGPRWVREALDHAGIDPAFATVGRKVTAVWRRVDVPRDLRRRIPRTHANARSRVVSAS